MDSASNALTLEQIANLVVEKLTSTGKLTDLANANLLTIEQQVIDQVDLITRAVICELLARQAKNADSPTACPRCHGQMNEKNPQNRSLQSRRGRVHFKTDVFHCEACRLDFFPSAQNAAV